MRKGRSIRALSVGLAVAGAFVVGSALPAGATVETYAGCDVKAPKPSLGSTQHFVIGTGSIDCNEYKTLGITVKMMVRDRPGDPWSVEESKSDAQRHVLGLSETVSGDCGFHTSGTFRIVTIATINGDKKPAVQSDTREC